MLLHMCTFKQLRPLPGESRGEPAHLIAVAEQVAALRGQPVQHVLTTAAHNAVALFGR